MFVLVLAVPALLVVVGGYVVGYGVWAAIVGSDGAEAAGWVSGAGALALTVRVIVLVYRRRRQ